MVTLYSHVPCLAYRGYHGPFVRDVEEVIRQLVENAKKVLDLLTFHFDILCGSVLNVVSQLLVYFSYDYLMHQ